MEMNAYVSGLAADLDQRCENLLAEIEAEDRHEDLHKLQVRTVAYLQNMRQRISGLLVSDAIAHPRLWRDALDTYAEMAQLTTLLESYAIPVILRYGKRDQEAAKFVRLLAKEIGYPQDQVPTITTTSEQYYWTYPPFGVISMPASDASGSILGWPDLVHEMAHNLLSLWPDFLNDFSPIVKRHFQNQRFKLSDLGVLSQGSPAALVAAQIRWQDGTDGTWRTEMASDLMATYLVGPSYGWQHLRLTLNGGDDPYRPCPPQNEVHPSAQARLEGVLAMLELLNQRQQAQDVSSDWLAYLQLKAYTGKPVGYDRYYPAELVKGLAKIVYNSSQRHGLMPFSQRNSADGPTVIGLMDGAWRVFRSDPVGYPKWEREAILKLRETV